MSDERLSRGVLRELNKTLVPLGLKVCARCQGHPQPLTNFYHREGGTGYKSVCKACSKVDSRVALRRRYQQDAEVRQHVLERNRRYWSEHRDTLIANKRARSLRRAFQAILSDRSQKDEPR